VKASEHDYIRLTDGRQGTVVHVCPDGKAYVVEFVGERGETLDMVTVEPDDIEEVIEEAPA